MLPNLPLAMCDLELCPFASELLLLRYKTRT